jgi:hypothetical protein
LHPEQEHRTPFRTSIPCTIVREQLGRYSINVAEALAHGAHRLFVGKTTGFILGDARFHVKLELVMHVGIDIGSPKPQIASPLLHGSFLTPATARRA